MRASVLEQRSGLLELHRKIFWILQKEKTKPKDFAICVAETNRMFTSAQPIALTLPSIARERTKIMEKLKLHSLGHDDHLKSLEEKYDGLRKTVEGNTNLTEQEKQTELKKIDDRLALQKRISKHNLY